MPLSPPNSCGHLNLIRECKGGRAWSWSPFFTCRGHKLSRALLHMPYRHDYTWLQTNTLFTLLLYFETCYKYRALVSLCDLPWYQGTCRQVIILIRCGVIFNVISIDVCQYRVLLGFRTIHLHLRVIANVVTATIHSKDIYTIQ